MASDNQYIITFKVDGDEEGGAPDGGVAKTSEGRSAAPDTKSLGKQLGGFAMAAAASAANQVITTAINQVSVRTGNSTMQQRLSFGYSTAMRALSIGGTVIGGLVTGNPMAVIAGIGSAVSWGVDIAIAQENLDLQRRVESISLEQTRIRAGAGGDRVGRSTY